MKYLSLLCALLLSVSCSGKAVTSENNAESVETNDGAAVIELPAGSTSISPDANLPTVIDFNATWCGPCRNFAPVFETVAEEMRGKVRFISVDVDKSPAVARQFGVTSIPQVTVLMPDGRSNSAIGYMTDDELTTFIAYSTGQQD